MAGDGVIVKLDRISHAYGITPVLHDIDLAVKSKEFLTLLGPSGCGKTTIFRIIAGFETPSRGRVFIDSQEATLLPPHRRRVNTVFQSDALFPHMTVFDNLAFGLKMNRLPKAEIRENAAGTQTSPAQTRHHLHLRDPRPAGGPIHVRIPDILGGAKSMLVGNFIKNQFLTARNWPVGSAASVVLTALMALLLLVYRYTSAGFSRERVATP